MLDIHIHFAEFCYIILQQTGRQGTNLKAPDTNKDVTRVN